VKILLLGNAQKAGVSEEASRLLPFLRDHCEIAVVDLLQARQLRDLPGASLALVLGGDGAILRAARQMGYQQIPVLGINLGRLGFLADLDPSEFRRCFPDILAGNYHITRHLMYECVVSGPAHLVPGVGGVAGEATQTYLGLNEVVFHSMPPFHMLDLDLAVNGVHVARFSGDGLIVSTPIGSTAHNLSAGGPILAQELDAFVLTPICPHTLTYRPVVESAAHEFTIELGPDEERAALIVDGQDMLPILPGQKVVIRRAPVLFQLVKGPGRSFFHILRDKLRWGTPPNYRGES